MKPQTNTRMVRRIITAVICVILTAAMTLGGSVNAAEALQWALEPTSVYKSIYHAGGDYWTVTDAQGRMGLIKTDGTVVVPFDKGYTWGMNWSDFESADWYSDDAIIVRNAAGLNGVIKLNGEVVIPFSYNWIDSPMSNGQSIASRNDKYGVIDKSGHTVIPFLYDYISSFDCEDYYEVSLGDLRGIADSSGKIVVPIEYKTLLCDTVSTYSPEDGGGEYFRKSVIKNRIIASKDGEHFGIIDYSNNIILPMIHHFAYNYYSGYYKLSDNVFVTSNNRYNEHYFGEAKYSEYHDNTKFGLVGVTGTPYLSPEYDDLSLCKDNMIIVKKDGKASILDYSGNVILPYAYNTLKEYKDDLLIASINDAYGVIDIKGNTVIPFIYGSLEPSKQTGLLIAKKLNGEDYLYGVIDANGNTIVPFLYESIGTEYNTELFWAYDKSFIHSIDRNGNIVNTIESERSRQNFLYGYHSFRENYKCGVKDANGNIIIPAKYDYIYGFHDILIARNERNSYDSSGHTYLFDYSGNIIFFYDEYLYIDTEYTATYSHRQAKVDNKTYCFYFVKNKSGNMADIVYDSKYLAVIECRCPSQGNVYPYDFDFISYSVYNDGTNAYLSFYDDNQSAILRLGALPGTVINEVLHTDIMCKIGGKAIRSYNIDGNTAIVAEELLNYGFGVVWDGDARTLSVTKGSGEAVGMGDIPKDTAEVGSYAMDVYATDITTYVDGKKVKGYNIGGYTIIFVDDLAVFGNVSWNGDAREITFEFAK